jgi:predicted ABC-type ATPase
MDTATAIRIALKDASDQLLVVLAGSNGSGKSTFHDLYIRQLGLPFVNADVIAKAMSLDALAAAKEADGQRQALLNQRRSFAMETVFSDRYGHKLSFLANSFHIVLIFIGISSAELSQARVMSRVMQGGHDVPDDAIFNRYPRTLENLARSIHIAQTVLLIDNDRADDPYRLVAVIDQGTTIFRDSNLPEWARLIVTEQRA